jgi:dienelactone hydrolase
MVMVRLSKLLALILVSFFLNCSIVSAQMFFDDSKWTVTTNIPITSHSRSFNGRQNKTEQVSADLFRPKLAGKMAAAVIINSSGGVTAHTELFYARVLASEGVAALVIDSFLPRGVKSTTADQGLVSPSSHYSDAAAGFRWLAKQDFVDATKIIVIGMSRGGNAAHVNASEDYRKLLGLEDTKFAAHVAVAPSCAWQPKSAVSTRAPIFFVLSERDDYTPIGPCLEYVERLRAAGNSNVRLAVYPGVFHAQEWTGGVGIDKVERSVKCSFFIDDRGRQVDRKRGQELPVGRERAHLLNTCLDTGPVTIGGDQRVKDQVVADILVFLREVGIVDDIVARWVVPDCAIFKSEVLKLNCARARAGWVGDLVALGRAYRYGSTDGPARDGAMAARLFTLASDRGHIIGDWELALMLLRKDSGVPQDIPRARRLLANAARYGESAAMNTLGVLARDGIGQEKNPNEAAMWFRRGVILRNSYSLANLGRLHWHGQGDVTQDDTEAVRLWRMAVIYANNPWALVFLGEALENGRGTSANREQAIEQYRVAAAQQREIGAAERAKQALARLGVK